MTDLLYDETNTKTEVILGIDASRGGSGGAKTHLIGILSALNPSTCGISKIHVWSYPSLLEAIPEQPWLVKHSPKYARSSLLYDVYWQRVQLPIELKKNNCTILLNTSAGTVCRFRPSVTMSREMLCYEPGEMQRYGVSKQRLRLTILRYLQNQSFKKSDGVIFLTSYAAKSIQKICGVLEHVTYIPHGISNDFRVSKINKEFHDDYPINCLYVSQIERYKHQCIVLRAIKKLRDRGFNVTLTLIGNGLGRSFIEFKKEMLFFDPLEEFIKYIGFVEHDALPSYYSKADIFVFASSCENMPNTLLEAMAAGLPIACSDRGPMPEVLEDAGVYFDPENDESIVAAIETLIVNFELRTTIADRALRKSKLYSWRRCAQETYKYVVHTNNRIGEENENDCS